ncbi:MAG: hypothetical protein LBU08_00875 [Tannerellaceae bacterium]|jgi:hypothetical protein|nr:hypothetical protein [Tannerellaceae bacterium]
MKKKWNESSLVFLACAALLTAACDNGNEPNPQTPVGETFDLGDGSTTFEVSGHLTLTYPNTYHLKGFVYVVAGATLTIEPGVIIKGDKDSKGTLIIERGGKLLADGTKECPIVFTSAASKGSRKPGDWGGLILLGKAPNNQGEMTIEGGVRSMHGGSDPDDNSGILRYLRIEFAGIEYGTDNEINGLTLGSVGQGTTIDYVQVTQSGDDAFEWFGGTVNASHIIAYRTWDDDFDTDNGFSGRIQFALAVRDPQTGDKSASNGFESDNNSSGTAIEPFTTATFANVSIFGPVANPANYVDRASEQGSKTDARFSAGLHLRRSTRLSIYNSLVAGFPIGIIIENDKNSLTQTWAAQGLLNVRNTVIAGVIKTFQDKQYWSNSTVIDPSDNGAFVSPWFQTSAFGNRIVPSLDALGLSLIPTVNSPLAFPLTGSLLLTGAGTLPAGFTPTSYAGAFASALPAADWTAGWANFSPQTTDY